MDEEVEKKIERVLSLSEENNKILRKLRRAQRWTTITRAVYWLIIIGASVGAFYFIQPYIKSVTNLYTTSADLFK